MNIHEELVAVKGRDEFVAFVYRLTEDLERNPESWANVTLKDYLQSIASWIEDGVHENEMRELELPSTMKRHKTDVEWERLAFLLFAAGRYE